MTDEEVLTEEESEALLERSDSAEPADATGVQEPGEEFWEQVSLDRIPALETINEGLAEALAAVWGQLFRRTVVVSPQVPRHIDGRRLLGSIEFEESIRSFDLSVDAEQCLMIVQPDTVSAMVDICFGGAGSGKRSERLAALTEMERRLFGRFADAMRDALNDVWTRNGTVSLRDSDAPFDGSTHSLCETSARSVVCRFLFDVGQEQHHIEFVWPRALIDSLKRKAPKSLPASQAAGEPNWTQRISEEVHGARIELRAIIGGVSLRLHEISTAKTGDIIMTDELSKVCLLAGDQPVFEGTLGSHEGFNAVKIKQPWVQKHFGDN